MDELLSAYQIGNFENNNLIGERYLSVQEYNEFLISHTFILNCKQIISLYTIIIRNYNELIDFDEELNIMLSKGDYPAIQKESQNIYIDINRLLLNYLSSVRLYVDYLQVHFSKNDALVPFMNEYTIIKSKCYDDFFAYRFLYKLRNYAQHIDLPISSISLKAKRISKGNYSYSIPIYFDTLVLLENYKSWGGVKRDLESMPKKIYVYNLLEDHFGAVKFIYDEVHSLIRVAASKHTSFLKDLTCVYRKKYKKLCVFKSTPIIENYKLKEENIKLQEINLNLLDYYTEEFVDI